MFCAISGAVMQEPVFVSKTGLLYEGRLLRKALETERKCPVTGVELQESDLEEVKTTQVTLPRPPSSSSFPSILSSLQQNWDSLLLEQVALRKELLETRKDLASALYEREAASAVIGRLLEENKHLKAELERLGGSAKMEIDSEHGRLGALINATAEELQNLRQTWKAPKPGDGSLVDLRDSGADWKRDMDLSPHKTSKPGVTCVAADKYSIKTGEQELNYLVTGGVDGAAKIIDAKQGQIAATLAKHSNAVNAVSMSVSAGVAVSASQDKTVQVWSCDFDDPLSGKHGLRHTLKEHARAVTACDLHPSCKIVLTAGEDSLWTIMSLDSGNVELKHSGEQPIFCASWHPDGRLHAVSGMKGRINVFNAATNPDKGPACEPMEHGANVRALSFSENGYLMASAGEDGVVKIWDLRTVSLMNTINCNYNPTALQFDHSGIFLAVGLSNGEVFVANKPAKKKKKDPWAPVVQLHEHKKKITGLVFAPNAKGLWVSSMDRTLAFYN